MILFLVGHKLSDEFKSTADSIKNDTFYFEPNMTDFNQLFDIFHIQNNQEGLIQHVVESHNEYYYVW